MLSESFWRCSLPRDAKERPNPRKSFEVLPSSLLEMSKLLAIHPTPQRSQFTGEERGSFPQDVKLIFNCMGVTLLSSGQQAGTVPSHSHWTHSLPLSGSSYRISAAPTQAAETD